MFCKSNDFYEAASSNQVKGVETVPINTDPERGMQLERLMKQYGTDLLRLCAERDDVVGGGVWTRLCRLQGKNFIQQPPAPRA